MDKIVDRLDDFIERKIEDEGGCTDNDIMMFLIENIQIKEGND